MPSNRCPKCQRKTYSPKYNSCTADGCSLNHSVVRYGPVLARAASDQWDIEHDMGPGIVTPDVTETLTVTKKPALNVTGKRGRPSKAGALTAAERQRAHRQKAKAS